MIEVKNVTKIFKCQKKYPGLLGAVKGIFSNEYIIKRAVSDISFKINDGEIVGYIGVNGAGKSTTIKMMTGVLQPTAGKCIVNGIDPSKQRKKNAKNIGVVFGQRSQLWWDLPVSESYLILKEIYNVSDDEFKKQMKFINDVLEIDKFWTMPVRVLSLGQRMRADLGAALIHNPPILYLDEPTIGLDVVVKDKIRIAIKEINKRYNTTVVLTTHDIGDIEELCNRIIAIDDGKIIYDGTLEKLKNMYDINRKLILNVDNIDSIRNIDLSQELGVDCNNVKEYFDDSKKVFSVVYNKNILNSSEILRTVMRYTNINEITVEKVELTDIVKHIYGK